MRARTAVVDAELYVEATVATAADTAETPSKLPRGEDTEEREDATKEGDAVLVHSGGLDIGGGIVVRESVRGEVEGPGLEDDVAWSGLDAGTRGVEGMMDENLVGS